MGHQDVGMEDYVAEDLRPLARCLADVESSDAYIGIFAWRFLVEGCPQKTGWVPLQLLAVATLRTGAGVWAHGGQKPEGPAFQ
jgi:hypothetical protein